MKSRNSGQFTRTIALTSEQLNNPDTMRQLRRGQWITANGSKGQFIGVDYADVVYVAWYMRGMTMRERNAKLQRMTTAFLHILTDQEEAQQREDARAIQRDIRNAAIRRYAPVVAMAIIILILSFFAPSVANNSPRYTNGQTAREYLQEHATKTIMQRYEQHQRNN